MEPRDLYGLPLDRFVAERGALAKSLRADGKRDEAAEVAKLRKPSVAAWAVNQLVRTQSREVKALFKAGDQLQRAQADLLAGKGDAGKLRAAAEREREAVDRAHRGRPGAAELRGSRARAGDARPGFGHTPRRGARRGRPRRGAGRLPRARASPRRPRRVRGARRGPAGAQAGRGETQGRARRPRRSAAA